MIRTGTARFWDMYWQPEATARAVEDAGLRATIGGPLFDADGRTAETQARVVAELEALADRVGDLASDLVYAASGSAVDTTVVAGRVLMRGGVVEDTAEIVARAAERARRRDIG